MELLGDGLGTNGLWSTVAVCKSPVISPAKMKVYSVSIAFLPMIMMHDGSSKSYSTLF